MYETAMVAGLRFLSVPFAQYSPAPWVASKRIATLGFCAQSGRANAISKSAALSGRKNIFMACSFEMLVDSDGLKSYGPSFGSRRLLHGVPPSGCGIAC